MVFLFNETDETFNQKVKSDSLFTILESSSNYYYGKKNDYYVSYDYQKNSNIKSLITSYSTKNFKNK